jgi:hypothetical protein
MGDGCGGAALIVKLKGFCEEEALSSVTSMVKSERPAAVGVPLITAPLRVSPAGKVPAANDQAYGVVPPIACKVAP